jgi:hypothetical protein
MPAPQSRKVGTDSFAANYFSVSQVDPVVLTLDFFVSVIAMQIFH